MTDIKSRLVDGMRGQGVLVPNPFTAYATDPVSGGQWWRIDEQNLEWIVERLLRTHGIAITATEEA